MALYLSSPWALCSPDRVAIGGEAAGDVSDHLPELLDCKRLMRETGLSRAGAEALMRRVPTVSIEGLRKTYVRRVDVATYLEARTFSKEQVPA